MHDPKSLLTFVLVRTQFASNLGSSVRAMKNMGFENLYLVRPECEVGIEARSFAMKGAGILDRARFFPSLESVADELGILAATTGRFRGAKPKLIDAPAFIDDVLPKLSGNRMGIVFGSEDNGLRREELGLCQWLVEIPTGSDYPVINLAQSVAMVAYHLHLSSQRDNALTPPAAAAPEQVESLLERIEELLGNLELSTRISSSRMMLRVRKIASRSRLEREDVNMLHGLFKELERKLKGDPGNR